MMLKVKVIKLKVRLSLLGRRKEGYLRRKRKLKLLRRKLVVSLIMLGDIKDILKSMVSILRSFVLLRWSYLIYYFWFLFCKLVGRCNFGNVFYV